MNDEKKYLEEKDSVKVKRFVLVKVVLAGCSTRCRYKKYNRRGRVRERKKEREKQTERERQAIESVKKDVNNQPITHDNSMGHFSTVASRDIFVLKTGLCCSGID